MAGEIAQHPAQQEGGEEVGDGEISLSGRLHVLNGAELDEAVSRISEPWEVFPARGFESDSEKSVVQRIQIALGGISRQPGTDACQHNVIERLSGFYHSSCRDGSGACVFGLVANECGARGKQGQSGCYETCVPQAS